MNRLLNVAIGSTVAFSALFNLQMPSASAQPPAAEPSPPPAEVNPAATEPMEAEPAATEPVETEPAATEPVVPEGYQRVTGDHWSFAVPSDWHNILSDAVELPEDASLEAQLNDSQNQTVVNLVTQSYRGDDQDYLEQSLDTLSELGFTVHTQESIALSEWQGVDLDVSLTSATPPTRLLQRLIAADGTSFALTCGGKAENFQATQSVCRTILNSFQVAR